MILRKAFDIGFRKERQYNRMEEDMKSAVDQSAPAVVDAINLVVKVR